MKYIKEKEFLECYKAGVDPHWAGITEELLGKKDPCNCRNIGKNGMACDDTLWFCDKCKDS